MKELNGLKEYLLNDSSEDAKRHQVYPFFKKIYKKEFKTESDAEGADIYIEGHLLVELKSANKDWLSGFYQGLHYSKKGLSFPNICVIAFNFLVVWRLNDIPDIAKEISESSDSLKAPSEIGKLNANKTSKAVKTKILQSAIFRFSEIDIEGLFAKDTDTELFEFLNLLNNLDAARIQINPRNFINSIEYLKRFFQTPMEAIHCFYDIIGYWDATSIVTKYADTTNKLQVIGKYKTSTSRAVIVNPKYHTDIKKYIESHYIFTNEGSDLRVDHYFSRFDEVISKLDPEYTKQHGIFFTDYNLSKFASWFVHKRFEKKLSEKYIVFDPAGGSGNLVSSWKGHLKYKIISELQPDLLRTIESRMELDPDQAGNFTVIPKTEQNKGLNFLDKTAQQYISEIEKYLSEEHLLIDKPIAFFLNPPYKSTDENVKIRKEKESDYKIAESILLITGADAGKERYLAFLGQILNISKLLYERPQQYKTVLFIFTPTSWLIPRPTYIDFREIFDSHFKFDQGFIINSKEFFDIGGSWPLAFTIWSYIPAISKRKNQIKLLDYTKFKKDDLQINWLKPMKAINKELSSLTKGCPIINFSKKQISIKSCCGQKMYDFKRNPTKKELSSNHIYGGLPLLDPRRNNQKTYGITFSEYIGFMDNATPVRIKPKENDLRFNIEQYKTLWFRLDNDLKSCNRTKIFNGPPDKYGYCAYDLESSKILFSWFAITKAIVGKYPLWANQFDIWKPSIKEKLETEFYSLCFSFGLSENRCIVTKFEENNPIETAPEVLIENPMSLNNPESFWNEIIKPSMTNVLPEAQILIDIIGNIYTTWNKKYCKGKVLKNIGLDDEPYFRYFNYPDFITPNSGLIQIKKYAEVNGKEELLKLFQQKSEQTKVVKDSIFMYLTDEFSYFK